jgi:hypothetical protein
MKFLDEEELESWYHEAKEKLDDTFKAMLDTKQDQADDIIKRYDAELKTLIAKYQLELTKLVTKKKK